MTVYVKLMGSLIPLVPHGGSGLIQTSLKDGSTVWEAIQELKIPADRVKLILVNHASAPLNQLLKDGDRVSIFPPEYPVFPDWKGSVLYRGPEGEGVEEGGMKKWKCSICDYIYDPAKGDPDNGVKPGTAFEKIPEDWVCPTCGAAKDMFELA